MSPVKLRDWLLSAALGTGVWAGIAAGLGRLIRDTPLSMRFGTIEIYSCHFPVPLLGPGLSALVLLAGAGLLYALLLLGPLADPGRRGVGLAYVLLSAWALVHAGSYDHVLGGAQLPGWGYAMVLAGPLLVRRGPLWTIPARLGRPAYPMVLILGCLACVAAGSARVSAAVGLFPYGDSLVLPGEYGKGPVDPWWERLLAAGTSTALMACAGALFLALLHAPEPRLARPVIGGLLLAASGWAFVDPGGYDGAARGLGGLRDTVWGYAILFAVPLLVSGLRPARRQSTMIDGKKADG